jgi:hypothetical protein
MTCWKTGRNIVAQFKISEKHLQPGVDSIAIYVVRTFPAKNMLSTFSHHSINPISAIMAPISSEYISSVFLKQVELVRDFLNCFPVLCYLGFKFFPIDE